LRLDAAEVPADQHQRRARLVAHAEATISSPASVSYAASLNDMIDALDAATRARIDTANPMRVQRAWEVQRATGRGLAAWQDATPPPLLPLGRAQALILDAPVEWLNARIARRFDLMLEQGALEEVRTNLPHWDPTHLSAKAIGAPELIAHLRGEIGLTEASQRATIATRQFAKRQRTWFRARMKDWHWITPPGA
jgi:tRNA dimethylallyltransferase